MSGAARRYAALPTAAKLLLILSAVLLPIGLALVWIARDGIREADQALRARAEEQGRTAARSVESLIARNALALRIAANGALSGGQGGACERAQRSLTIAPAVEQRFQLHNVQGELLCELERIANTRDGKLVAPGDIDVAVAPSGDALILRVGVIGGMATGSLSVDELRAAALDISSEIESLVIRDRQRTLPVVTSAGAEEDEQAWMTRWPIAGNQLTVQVEAGMPQINTVERLLLLLPLLMWVLAALLTWLLVSRALIRPLNRLQTAVIRFQPGDSPETLPRKLGPAREIQGLRDSFARAVARVEESERDMALALDGQRRLVREVHHRVKNNLQVVASLLNIHGRSAESAEASAAYAAISRRVGALSIVHRNHFAEMEENRGIALRPLLSELAAELRGSAPEQARRLVIDLDVEAANTTQDVAVSVAFLVTEIVEFAMLRRPQDPVEISLRRTSELTARLMLTSPVLVPEEADQAEKLQFERIVGGLAKQLRSPLERKLGRYSVDLPVFPPA